jgi:hypothetical protein
MMAHKILATVNDQSLRPLTQALVGALEITLDEIAALRNFEQGPWIGALEERVLQTAAGLVGRGSDADSLQIAQSALRACFRNLRSQCTDVIK